MPFMHTAGQCIEQITILENSKVAYETDLGKWKNDGVWYLGEEEEAKNERNASAIVKYFCICH